MERLPIIREEAAKYPTPQPIFKVDLDYSGDLCFRKPDESVPSPFGEDADWLHKQIDENINNRLQPQEDGTYKFENNIQSTESSIVSNVVSSLKNTLQRAMPHKEPTRTSLYKFFRNYSPSTDKEKEFVLAVYDFVKNNQDACETPKSKQAEALIGLVTHIRSKNDR